MSIHGRSTGVHLFAYFLQIYFLDKKSFCATNYSAKTRDYPRKLCTCSTADCCKLRHNYGLKLPRRVSVWVSVQLDAAIASIGMRKSGTLQLAAQA